MSATLLEALAHTASDLLLGFSIAFTLFLAALLFLGWHYTEHYRKPRWEARARRERVRPIDFSGEIRVRDKTRRGPAPIEHHGRKRVGL